MADVQLIVKVKFRSSLPLDEVRRVAEERADDFRALTGLIQKYYYLDRATGEIGGLYLWDSAQSFADYRDSELRKTIGAAYKTEGEPSIEVLEVLMPLR